jgi:uncharacterized membrane protein YbhN (UPF0104 family)
MKVIPQKSLPYLLTLIILAFAIYYFIHNWKSVSAVHWWENPGFLSIHIFFLVLTFIFFVIGWRELLRITGNRVGIRVAGFTWLAPNIGKYIPGKVFMVAGRIALLNRLGLRKGITVGNFIWENVILILAAMPFSLFVLLNYASAFPYEIITSTICLLILVLLIALNPTVIQRAVNFLLNIFKKPPLTLALKRQAILYLFVLYVIAWIFYGLSGITLAYALGIEDKVPPALLFNVCIFSWLVGFISVITPGGLGIREGVLILMMNPYIPMSELMVFALLARMTWTITELVGVIVGVILGRESGHQYSYIKRKDDFRDNNP